MRCHRLDNTTHCPERQTERTDVIHRNHAPLLWFKWTSSSLVLPIRFRIRRLAKNIIRCPDSTRLTSSRRNVCLWYHHWWVPLPVLPLVFSFDVAHRAHQATQYLMSFDQYFQSFRLFLFSGYSPTDNLSYPSALYAYLTPYPSTATSINSLEHPV